MLLDNAAELATTVAFDLDTVRPGPGKPVKMWAHLDSDGALAITHGATSAAAGALITIACVGVTQFELPSSTLQWIKSTFTGRVGVVMDAQTCV